MIPIPAIDLKGGNVVRLFQGDFKAETVYSEGPDQIARRFEGEGAQRIHVVDLDGALNGKPANQALVERILKAVRCSVEVGGGIRDLRSAAHYFEMGVRWVIFGTKACLDPGFAREACQEFREKVIFGIDARSGFVATDGWTKITQTKAVDLVKSLAAMGARTVIYTDIAKDGALSGPNYNEIRSLSESVDIDVIASGGISALEDVSRLLAMKRPNVHGVIIGKALYEGKISLREAVKLCSQNA